MNANTKPVNFTVCGECSFTDMVVPVAWCSRCGLCPNCCRCPEPPKCEACGSTQFTFYQTITEAAVVQSFDENGAAVLELDAKWEVTDAHDSEIRCENGHALECSEAGPWTGDVL